MNIFYLHENPTICAEYHNDKHVVKMILETAQLLCTAHHLAGTQIPPYKATHKNHPCSVWTRSSIGNYKWLCELGLALCIEYTKRYGRIHKTQQHIFWLMENIPTKIVDTEFYEPPKCMDEQYQKEDVIDSYKAYYIEAKAHLAKWKTIIPDWYKTEIEEIHTTH